MLKLWPTTTVVFWVSGTLAARRVLWTVRSLIIAASWKSGVVGVPKFQPLAVEVSTSIRMVLRPSKLRLVMQGSLGMASVSPGQSGTSTLFLKTWTSAGFVPAIEESSKKTMCSGLAAVAVGAVMFTC